MGGRREGEKRDKRIKRVIGRQFSYIRRRPCDYFYDGGNILQRDSVVGSSVKQSNGCRIGWGGGWMLLMMMIRARNWANDLDCNAAVKIYFRVPL